MTPVLSNNLISFGPLGDPISVKRSVKKFREKGIPGFYAERRVRGAAILVADVVAKAEELLTEDAKISDVARQINVSPDTLRKAVKSGRVRVKKTARRRAARAHERRRRRGCQRSEHRLRHIGR